MTSQMPRAVDEVPDTMQLLRELMEVRRRIAVSRARLQSVVDQPSCLRRNETVRENASSVADAL